MWIDLALFGAAGLCLAIAMSIAAHAIDDEQFRARLLSVLGLALLHRQQQRLHEIARSDVFKAMCFRFHAVTLPRRSKTVTVNN